MTRIDLTELRTLAQGATPGPWEAEDGVFVVADGRPLISRLRDGNGDGFLESAADAEYIAALNPATVLRLLDALDEVLSDAHWLSTEQGRARAGGRGCVCPQCRMTQRVITTLKGAEVAKDLEPRPPFQIIITSPPERERVPVVLPCRRCGYRP